jgi:hypothetical protein
MTIGEAKTLTAQLIAAYPSANVHGQTASLWISELRSLDYDLAQTAVRSLLEGCKFFPSFAELHEHIGYERERRNRAQREAERKAADQAADELPRIPLRDIPQVQTLLTKFRRLDQVGEPTLPAGRCGECHKNANGLYELGKFQLCHDCRSKRLAAERLLKKPAIERSEWVPNETEMPLPADKTAQAASE